MTDTARKKILLGVTGGIAAYKAAELVRRLSERSVDVHVVMTQAACGFITPATLQALSGNPVFTDMWDPRIRDSMAHIELSRDKHLIVIAPATADFLAKLAVGIADDLLSTLCLARDCPLVVAPAMNRQMWEHPATQRNVAQLNADRIEVLGPAAGDQACGEVGMGRMLEAIEIAQSVTALLAPKALAGVRMLVTAGPTFEAIDAVRGLTNQSSGKMGYAVARAAVEAGADVTLVSGPTSLTAPARVERVDVVSADDMLSAVKKRVAKADVFVSVAAVADYRPAKVSEQKIKKGDRAVSLELVPNEDILAYVAALPKAPFCVGFAAESEKLAEYAEEKRRRKKVPLLAANLVQHAIGADDNEITLFDDEGAHPLPRAPKEVVARQLVAHIAKLYKRPRTNS
ncbi:MAG: Coenzyme biosynthesis bifunctional protein CoaBC [Betaproteobacteria bacterium]|nr:Coenzyme biosynthesis bifunctional protein CoaBC [Betaproteobacteria bacterium]MEA3153787.1 phosphopantothenoylcysteine decarboxylase / phosphopantothenate---cysteine ligase [Betaproteobacteria bacterium]